LALLAGLIASAGAATSLADEADAQYAVAAGHYARRRWELAADEFTALLQKFPQHPQAKTAAFFAAEALLQLKKYAEARDNYRQCLQAEIPARHRRLAKFRIGEASFLLGDRAAAAEELLAFQAAYPDDHLGAYALCYLGELALADEAWELAEHRFREALEKYPAGPREDDCRLGLAKALEQQSKTDDAALLYAALAAKRSSPLAARAQWALGGLHFKRRDFKAAEESLALFETAFQDHPLCEPARLERAKALLQLQDHGAAERLLMPLTQSGALRIEAAIWLAQTFRAQKQWDRAVEVLDGALAALGEATDQHELAPALVFHAGDSLRRGGKLDEAQKRYELLVTRWPHDRLADDALLGQIRVSLERHDHAAIEQLTKQLERDWPDSSLLPTARQLRARSLIEHGDYRAAAELLDALVIAAADQRSRLASQQLLAVARLAQGDASGAWQVLQQVLPTAEGELLAQAQWTAARALISLGRIAEAIPLLESLSAATGGVDAAACQAELALCYARVGNTDKARRAYASFVARHAASPLMPHATLRLADAAFCRGDYSFAAELYTPLCGDQQAIETAAPALLGLAWSHYQARQHQQATEACRKLLARFPQHDAVPEALLLLGRSFEAQGQHERALEHYLQLVGTHPGSKHRPAAMLAAAQAHSKLSQHAQAAALYQRFTREFPERPELDQAHYLWAWALVDLGQTEAAARQFELVYRQFPRSPHWADAAYRFAESTRSKDPAQATQALMSLIAARPEPLLLGHALYLRGRIAEQAQDWAAVAAAMQKLLHEVPQTPLYAAAEYWLAEAAYQRGLYEESATRFERLVPPARDKGEAWAPVAALRQAQSLACLQRWPQAQAIAASLARDFPNFELLYEVDYVLGRCQAAAGLFDEARAAYRRVVNSPAGGKTETAAKAQWMIGESWMHQRNYQAALREYLRVEVLYDYPTWQAAALLQAGKCYEHLQRPEAAAELYLRIVNEFSQTDFKNDAQQRLQAVGKQTTKMR
jgi:TolA-binding protein